MHVSSVSSERVFQGRKDGIQHPDFPRARRWHPALRFGGVVSRPGSPLASVLCIGFVLQLTSHDRSCPCGKKKGGTPGLRHFVVYWQRGIGATKRGSSVPCILLSRTYPQTIVYLLSPLRLLAYIVVAIILHPRALSQSAARFIYVCST